MAGFGAEPHVKTLAVGHPHYSIFRLNRTFTGHNGPHSYSCSSQGRLHRTSFDNKPYSLRRRTVRDDRHYADQGLTLVPLFRKIF